MGGDFWYFNVAHSLPLQNAREQCLKYHNETFNPLVASHSPLLDVISHSGLPAQEGFNQVLA